ncbi:MAG TPA: putative baseplate assembly protein, partial [Steroidobacteraceae bacterium]
DILTFYQERFANEAYLRTAVDQRSVFELSRLVGYTPSPGVSASTVLAFTLSSAPGSPDNVLIPAGTRAQSVPGPGQTPQMFETTAAITALIDYNALPAQTTVDWQLYGGDTSTWIKGTANNVNVGDVLLIVSANNGVPADTGPGDVRYVTKVTTDTVSGNTQITWDSRLSSSFAAGQTAPRVCIYVFRKKAALYGAQAPNAATLPTTATGHPGTGANGDWNYFQYRDGTSQINLDASYAGLTPTADNPQWVVLTGLGYTSFFKIVTVAESNPNLYTLTTKTTQLTVALGRILTGDTALTLDEVLWEFTGETRDITAYVQSEPLKPADLPITRWDGGYKLQTGMLAPVAGSSLSVEGGQQIAVGQPVGISGRRVRLQVLPGAGATFTPTHSSASLAAADNQIFLVDAYPPSTDPGNGPPEWSVITLNGISATLSVADASVRLLPSDPKDPLAGEAADVNGPPVVKGDFTTLTLSASLGRIYDAATVTVNANAVMATNGETQQEILGSGDATDSALQFTLKQAPLTYVSAPAGNGTQSTLQVWVNNMRWQEVPNLLASGPADRVFVTAVSPTGNVVVQFGNGIEGARAPTGQSNIRAVYRKGIGSAGMVAAGQVSQALDRPQGLKSVSNPGPGAGGADPATADEARASAPLPTLTLGRVVSLEDYQNFALNFGGIAKASASWTRFSGSRGVFLTVAGADGATLSPTDLVVINLLKALRTSGNPYVPLYVASYQPVLFQLVANLQVDWTDYDPTQVLAQVWQNLSTAFAFERRLLGQGVAASELIQIMQQTPGVIALQLQALFPSRSPPVPGTPVPTRLCAASAIAAQ